MYRRDLIIKKTGLYKAPYTLPTPGAKAEPTPLEKEIKRTIGVQGPISVGDYMRECLNHPQFGYYMQRNVFGKDGDFITSPDVSQLFGESLGLWCVTTWRAMGSPKAFRLVELGPGRGKLMHDALRITKHFKDFTCALQAVHLVENSTTMREFQRERLGVTIQTGDTKQMDTTDWGGTTADDTEVHWHWMTQDLPQDVPIILLANEFLDALPIQQFQFCETRGWLEKMVDVDVSDSPNHFRFVLARSGAVKGFIPDELQPTPPHDHPNSKEYECSPASRGVVQEICKRIRKQGGAALLIDYGQDKANTDSLQAMKDHKLFIHPLDLAGKADLTAFVDFDALKTSALEMNDIAEGSHEIVVHPLINQQSLLRECNIAGRLQQLIDACETDEDALILLKGAERIMADDFIPDSDSDEEENAGEDKDKKVIVGAGMGNHFKCLCITDKKTAVPAGFIQS